MSDELDQRDWFVGNAVRAAKRDGREIDVREVEKQAARDLEHLARARAEGALLPSKREKAPEVDIDPRKWKQLEDLAASKDAEVYNQALPKVDRPGILPALGGVDEERRIAMLNRIRIICQPVENPRPGAPLGEHCRYPELAISVTSHTYCMARGMGGYKGLAWPDRMRRYQRAIEDICDRSNAVVGYGWWVKR